MIRVSSFWSFDRLPIVVIMEYIFVFVCETTIKIRWERPTHACGIRVVKLASAVEESYQECGWDFNSESPNWQSVVFFLVNGPRIFSCYRPRRRWPESMRPRGSSRVTSVYLWWIQERTANFLGVNISDKAVWIQGIRDKLPTILKADQAAENCINSVNNQILPPPVRTIRWE